MTTELQTYTAQLPAVPDVRPDQVEWIAKVRQSPVLRMDEVLNGTQFESSVEARARIIQRKRAVWDKLVNKPIFL